jgi:hypothetical protein
MSINYQFKNGGILRLSDNVLIPISDGNMDYDNWLAYTIAGGETLPEFTAEELKAIKIAEINQRAYDEIIAIAPLYKQNNMLARSIELTSKSSLTADEQSELDSINAKWEAIKAIRAKSNLDCANVG